MFLACESLSCHLSGKAVLNGIQFYLKQGEIACLLGPSGCGKTTLLRCLAGFEQATHGKIELNQCTLFDNTSHVPPEKRQIGMVFQDYALLPNLTVAKNIALALWQRPQAEQKQKTAEVLDWVGLNPKAHAYPHQLSGGQQQRVALARALATSPQLMLLDEPFSNLDADLREKLSQETRSILKRSGITAIMVTHDQQEAFSFADKIGVMRQGTISQWASPYELYHQPASPFEAKFIGQGVFTKGVVTGPKCIRLELGEFCGTLPLGFEIGDKVEVLLRPDDVQHDDASPFKALVKAKYFKGAVFHYVLSLASGQELLAEVPSHHNHAIGEAIGIRLELDHLIAFKPS